MPQKKKLYEVSIGAYQRHVMATNIGDAIRKWRKAILEDYPSQTTCGIGEPSQVSVISASWIE